MAMSGRLSKAWQILNWQSREKQRGRARVLDVTRVVVVSRTRDPAMPSLQASRERHRLETSQTVQYLQFSARPKREAQSIRQQPELIEFCRGEMSFHAEAILQRSRQPLVGGVQQILVGGRIAGSRLFTQLRKDLVAAEQRTNVIFERAVDGEVRQRDRLAVAIDCRRRH